MVQIVRLRAPTVSLWLSIVLYLVVGAPVLIEGDNSVLVYLERALLIHCCPGAKERPRESERNQEGTQIGMELEVEKEIMLPNEVRPATNNQAIKRQRRQQQIRINDR